MTPAQTATLLTLAATFDQRTIGRADIGAWHTVLADIPLHEARAAVLAYYGTNRDRVMPADIREHVRAARHQAAEARFAAATAVELTPPDGVVPVAVGIAHLATTLGIARGLTPDQATTRHREHTRTRSTACPWCKARPWEPCVIPGVIDTKGNPRRLGTAHPSRLSA